MILYFSKYSELESKVSCQIILSKVNLFTCHCKADSTDDLAAEVIEVKGVHAVNHEEVDSGHGDHHDGRRSQHQPDDKTAFYPGLQ